MATSEAMVRGARAGALAILLGATAGGAAAQSNKAPMLRIEDTTVPFEGPGGAGIATFRVHLLADSTGHGQVSVLYSTVDGTATGASQCAPGIDYGQTNSASLLFLPSDSVKEIVITTCGDTLDEPDETFMVNLFNATGGAIIDDGQGVATIKDDDPAPSLRIDDVRGAEGAPGTTSAMTFTVSLSAESGRTVTASFSTGNQTATGGSCGTADFATRSGSVTFQPGQRTQTLDITVCGDGDAEGDETFTVRLAGASNATISDGTGVGTIANDDFALSAADVVVAEGDAGSTAVTFNVDQTPGNGQGATVQYELKAGTASAGACGSAGADFAPARGTLTFGPNATRQPVTVEVCGDRVREGDERFSLLLSSASGASIADGEAIAVIRDNEPVPSAAITDTVGVVEPSSGSVNAVFTVTLSVPSQADVRVNWQTRDGTAQAAGLVCGTGDYLARSGTLTFSGGATRQTLSVPVCADRATETIESFLVVFTGASGANAPSRPGGTALIAPSGTAVKK